MRDLLTDWMDGVNKMVITKGFECGFPLQMALSLGGFRFQCFAEKFHSNTTPAWPRLEGVE